MRTLVARTLFALAAFAAVPQLAHADDADASYKQGLAYKQQGKTDEAIAAMEQTVAKNPRHFMAWASLGNLYKGKKDIAKAVTAYEHAVEGLKKDKIVWSNLGMAQYRLYEQGGKKDAAELDKAIASSSRLPARYATPRLFQYCASVGLSLVAASRSVIAPALSPLTRRSVPSW